MIFRQPIKCWSPLARRPAAVETAPVPAIGETARTPNWYWAAPMLLDEARDDVDVEPCSRLETASGAPGAARGTRHWTSRWNIRGRLTGEQPLGRQPKDLVQVLARLAVAGPGVTALRALSRSGFDLPTQVAAARIGWGMRLAQQGGRESRCAHATPAGRGEARQPRTGETPSTTASKERCRE